MEKRREKTIGYYARLFKDRYTEQQVNENKELRDLREFLDFKKAIFGSKASLDRTSFEFRLVDKYLS